MNNFEKAYIDLIAKRTRANQIMALYYRGSDGASCYTLFELGNVKAIEEKIGKTDGKAMNMEIADRNYWILMSQNKSGNFILFRRDKFNNQRPYFDIAPDVQDMAAMDCIAGL